MTTTPALSPEDLEAAEQAQAALVAARRRQGLADDGTDPDAAAAGDHLDVASTQVGSGPTSRQRHDNDTNLAAVVPAPRFDPPPALVEQRRQKAWDTLTADATRFRDVDPEQVAGDVAETLSGWDGTTNVVLLGPTGVGKTATGFVLLRRAIFADRSAAFFPTVDLLDALRPHGTDPAGTIEVASNVDVLLLDDIDRHRTSDWTDERFYKIINRRWMNRRATIVTANTDTSEFRRRVGAAFASRLIDGALVVEHGGTDRRRPGGGR